MNQKQEMTVSLIDTHAHIQSENFADDVEQVVERAHGAGVEKIIVVGGAGELTTNESGLAIAKHHAGAFATVGMHPHDARHVTEEDFQKLRALTEDPKVVAVGETGLDFYYDHSPRDVQMEVFSRFIHLAWETKLPLVVHDRDAHEEVEGLIQTHGQGEIRGVIHCFTGDMKAAKAFLDLGFYLSFTGIITFKNAALLRDVVREVPMDRIMVETDSPYLAPVPHRGKRNEPAFVRFVAEAIAQVKGLTLDEVALATNANAHNLFGI